MGEAYDKFLAIPTSQKVAIFVLLMGLVGAGWYFLFFEETQASLDKATAQTPKLNDELAEEQEIEKNLVRYQEEIETLRKQRDDMRDRLPDSAEIADLLAKIHGQAKIVGLEISRFERQDNEPEAMYARIPVRMVLSGSFHEITNFFFYLGKLTRIVNVENIELTSTQDKTRKQNNATDRPSRESELRALCTATTFMYLPPEAAAPKRAVKAKKKKGK